MKPEPPRDSGTLKGGRPRSSPGIRVFIGVTVSALVLISSGYALTTTPVLPSTLPFLLLLFFGLLASLFVLRLEIPRGRNWRSLILAALIALVSMVSALVNSAASLPGVLWIPLLIFVAFLFSQLISFDTFINWFIGCMTIFALLAFVVDFLFVTLGLPLMGYEVTNTNGAIYANGLIVFLFIDWDGALVDRAMGPFWEPGLFASFLIIALIFEISYRRFPARKWVVISLIAGVFVARSTAGYLLLLPVLALFLFKRRTTLARFFAGFTSLILLASFILLDRIVGWLVSIDPDLFGKLERDALMSSTRYNVFALNLSLFSEAPVIGYGFPGAGSEVVSRMSEWGVSAQTSTSTFYLAALGLFGIIYTLSWFSILMDRQLFPSERIVILTCFLIILNKEPHTSLLVSVIILFYFVSRSKGEARVREKENRSNVRRSNWASV